MSYFDTLLTTELDEKSIPYQILSHDKTAQHENYINENFKFKGSFIDWATLENHQSLSLKNVNRESLSPYLIEEESEILIFGDSLTEESYVIKPCHLEAVIKIFSEIPQHTYFLPTDLSWILCIKSDGEADIGINKTKSSQP